MGLRVGGDETNHDLLKNACLSESLQSMSDNILFKWVNLFMSYLIYPIAGEEFVIKEIFCRKASLWLSLQALLDEINQLFLQLKIY